MSQATSLLSSSQFFRTAHTNTTNQQVQSSHSPSQPKRYQQRLPQNVESQSSLRKRTLNLRKKNTKKTHLKDHALSKLKLDQHKPWSKKHQQLLPSQLRLKWATCNLLACKAKQFPNSLKKLPKRFKWFSILRRLDLQWDQSSSATNTKPRETTSKPSFKLCQRRVASWFQSHYAIPMFKLLQL